MVARAAETAAETAAAEGVDFFEKHVRPLFSQNCLSCHGEKQKGGLRLDSRRARCGGGDSGPAVVPGDPAASPLIQALHYDDEPKMPPARQASARGDCHDGNLDQDGRSLAGRVGSCGRRVKPGRGLEVALGVYSE